MYRLEDLLEEVDIADRHDKQMAPAGKLTKTVCLLPSMLGSLKMNKRLFYETQDTMRELDRIKSDMDRFQFNVCPIHLERGASNMINRREDTYSFIREEEVVGRDEDKNVILRMVLECGNLEEDLCVIPIVGMGGLGKTTLAQLIYNDKTVERHFELKCWACISDQICSFDELAWRVLHSMTRKECESLIAEEPVGKVLRSMNGEECRRLSGEQVQSRLRQAVNGKKFLLVLDDVWDENRETWLRLKSLLCGGKQGSKILVTTRSEVVASNMGTIKPHLLGTLPEEKSWALFKSLAFKDGQEAMNPNLTSIGKEIVKKCGNVPLAIRTIAGLLYSRDTEQEWAHFRNKEIGMIEQTQTGIMRTLKISYDHLLPQQKQCFAYCSLFPKDYTFRIRRLIQLWMAQGFVRSMDDGYIHFMELLRRCFFHNVRRDWDVSGVWDGLKTCQMHGLMHDLARKVGDECLIVNRPRGDISNNIKHVHIVNPSGLDSQARPWLSSSLHLRTFIIRAIDSKSVLNHMFSSLRHIRALNLGIVSCKLPNSIGELKHLRYLRGSIVRHNLPKAITKLQCLQTLDLQDSIGLKELPSKFYKLTSLKHLQILYSPGLLGDFSPLTDMPPRFAELISLQSVDAFIVGQNGLDALSRMNLVGKLVISYKKQRQNDISEAMKANLKDKKLTDLLLDFHNRESVTDAEKLLECLQPPPTLKKLKVKNWKGVRFPNWGLDELPSLVSFTISDCTGCQHLPPFSGLPHIKKLIINNCEDLDLWDVKNEDGDVNVMSSPWACLRSLNSLYLLRMSNLQSLPSGIGGITMLQELLIMFLDNLRTLPFSIGLLTQLRVLQIQGCPNLEALPTSIQNLAALQGLRIYECPLLKTRCEEPDGDDWPLIQHIPCKNFISPY